MSEFEYKGIHAKDVWKNGNWYTEFSMSGEVLKVVERQGNFGDEETKKIIRTQILRFI